MAEWNQYALAWIPRHRFPLLVGDGETEIHTSDGHSNDHALPVAPVITEEDRRRSVCIPCQVTEESQSPEQAQRMGATGSEKAFQTPRATPEALRPEAGRTLPTHGQNSLQSWNGGSNRRENPSELQRPSGAGQSTRLGRLHSHAGEPAQSATSSHTAASQLPQGVQSSPTFANRQTALPALSQEIRASQPSGWNMAYSHLIMGMAKAAFSYLLFLFLLPLFISFIYSFFNPALRDYHTPRLAGHHQGQPGQNYRGQINAQYVGVQQKQRNLPSQACVPIEHCMRRAG